MSSKETWIESYLDNTLSPHEIERFKEALSKDESLRHDLQLALETKAMTRLIQTPYQPSQENEIMKHISELTQDPLVEEVMSQIPPKPKQVHQNKTFLWALAAQIFITIGLVYFFTDRPSPKAILLGQVKKYEGKCFVVRDQEKLNLENGMNLYHMDQVFVEEIGNIQFEYLDGSSITFNHYSYAHLIQGQQGKKIYLYSGTMNGDIAKQPKDQPLRIITEHSESVVLGTKIEINSSPDSTLLTVQEGEVEMKPRQGGKSLIVESDQYGVSNDDQLSLHQVCAPLYVSELITSKTPNHSVDIDIPLNGAKQLYLIVTDGGNDIHFDHACWDEPTIHHPNGKSLLTELKWTFQSCGWSNNRVNRGYLSPEVYMDGRKLNNVLVTHSNSVIVYDLPPGAERFTSTAGLLQSGIQQKHSRSSVTFEVYTHLPEEKVKALSREGYSF